MGEHKQSLGGRGHGPSVATALYSMTRGFVPKEGKVLGGPQFDEIYVKTK